MLSLRNQPIKTKLIAMMTITSSIGIVLMAVAIIINEAVARRDSILVELSTLAEVIGSRSTGSLTFNDPRTALENLSALKAKKNVIYAIILDEQERVFAEYQPKPANVHLEPSWLIQLLQKLSFGVLTNTITVARPILLVGQPIGNIRIVSSMKEFYTNLVDFLGLVAVIALGCFGINLAVSARLHKYISEPVLKLSQATNTVSADNDYSIRISNTQDDELGTLIDSFNNMLEQIEVRDQQLAGYSHQLKAEVEVRTGELLEANQRRIHWLENMAKFLKHELKNATVGIKSSLELIERRSQQAAIDVYIARARKSIGFMRVLLDSVSNASSLEAAVYKESLHSLNISQLFAEEMDAYRSFYPDYSLIYHCDPDLHVLGNADRLKQLLDKLVGNAFEHCQEGSPIIVSMKANNANAELSVSNQGVALPEDKARIFDLFVSLRDAEHWKSDSLGLGLYIVKLIAESHKGTVLAQNRDDVEGAIFTVSIPLMQAQ